MASEISVIICAYTEKRWEDLVAAVESVRSQALPAKEIIVVIDHNQQLLEQVQQKLPDVVAIENTEVRGLSGARNSGIAIARGMILAFLDDDALAADWLKPLAETFAEPEVLGVGGPIIPLWLVQKPAWLPEEFYWVVGCTYRGMPETVSKVRNIIGANMAFRREVFEVVGGFRSEIGRVGTLPLGCEETELCIRAQQHWPARYCLYQPAASVSHKVPGTRTNWHYFFSRCYSEGISKAFVARFVGTKDGLASERTYTLRILPLGVMRGLGDGLFHLDLNGFARAWAIIAGLASTTIGYLVGTLSQRAAKSEFGEKDRAHETVYS
ncbi:MAG TPA: glycosyltransferase family 2 protein [Ktedonobacteraceae bacterium]